MHPDRFQSRVPSFGYRKGQINSLDMLITSVIFVLLIVFLVVTWYNSTYSARIIIEKNNMERSLLGASDILLKTRGLPDNWEANVSTVKMLGLAKSQNVLSASKLANFTSLIYSTAKTLLGYDYDFYFFVENINGSSLYQIGNVSASNRTVSITRFAILNNQKVRLRIGVYG